MDLNPIGIMCVKILKGIQKATKPITKIDGLNFHKCLIHLTPTTQWK